MAITSLILLVVFSNTLAAPRPQVAEFFPQSNPYNNHRTPYNFGEVAIGDVSEDVLEGVLISTLKDFSKLFRTFANSFSDRVNNDPRFVHRLLNDTGFPLVIGQGQRPIIPAIDTYNPFTNIFSDRPIFSGIPDFPNIQETPITDVFADQPIFSGIPYFPNLPETPITDVFADQPLFSRFPDFPNLSEFPNLFSGVPQNSNSTHETRVINGNRYEINKTSGTATLGDNAGIIHHSYHVIRVSPDDSTVNTDSKPSEDVIPPYNPFDHSSTIPEPTSHNEAGISDVDPLINEISEEPYEDFGVVVSDYIV